MLIKSKFGFVSFGNDNKVLNYLNIKNNYKMLNDYKISYIILEDLNIIKVKRFKNNKYKKYLKLSYLKDILNNSSNANNVFNVNSDGNLNNNNALYRESVRSSVYLKSDIKIVSGSGTKDDMFKLEI